VAPLAVIAKVPQLTSVVLGGLGLGVTIGTLINRDILDDRNILPGGNPIENMLCTTFFQCGPYVDRKCRAR